MPNGKTHLVLSGLPLANPHVGQGVYTSRLIEALARNADIDFAVVVRPDAEIPNGLPRDRFIILPEASTPRHELIAQILWSQRLLRFVAKEFPNAIFHSPGPISGSRPPNPIVVTIHDCIYRTFPRYAGRLLVRKLFLGLTERFAERSSMVLTDSEFSKRELVTYAGISAQRVSVLYPWVGPEYFDEISDRDIAITRQRLGLPEQFWLYVGGYDYRKNLEFLLRAYAKATEQAQLPPLLLAGTIPRRAKTSCDVYGTLRENDLPQDQIILAGPISHVDLPVLYRAASLFIFPSLMEGFGLPPAEALAVGTPVLVSNKSSLPEVVQTPHCLFDPTDLEDLIQKLIAASDNEKQFTAELDDRFTESYAIKRYLDILNGIAAGTYVSS